MPEARIDKWMMGSPHLQKLAQSLQKPARKDESDINGSFVKSSSYDKTRRRNPSGKKPPITYSFKVLQAIEKRVGAKLVSE